MLQRPPRRSTPVRCPHCGQLYLIERLGVRMTPRKAAIVDAIIASPGISTQELAEATSTTANVRNHIIQINELLAGTAWRLRGRSSHGYRLVEVDANGKEVRYRLADIRDNT